MRIGVDLDNTIICYGPLFHAVAVARGLVPSDLPSSKQVIKTWIQNTHGNPAWTALQAEVYGPMLCGATAYPGVFEFFCRCRSAEIETCIISHKSQFPALGVHCDLRVAALHWLENNGWFGPESGLSPAEVEFHDTREEKVAAIARRQCDLFIDDLPEVFRETHFPPTTSAILFDPESAYAEHKGIKQVAHWHEIEDTIFLEKMT